MIYIFSKYQFGFRKGFSAQHCLLAMIEKWHNSKDKGKFFDLLAAELSAYGFDNNSTQFLFELTNHKQRPKIGQVYSPWDEITSGVPQGSTLGPLIFNIDLCDMFFTLNNHEIASYADDNTPYVTCDTIKSMLASL